MANIIRQFPNILDWINYSENDNPRDAHPSRKESIPTGSDWYGDGVKNKEQAYDLLRKGWPKGLAAMRKVMDCVRNLVSIESPQYTFVDAVEGSAPNIEAYLHGIPEDMHFMEQIQMDAPPTFLHVQLDMTVACFTSATQCTWAGAVVFAAIEVLHAQGCATQLLMSHSVSTRGWQGGGTKYSIQVPVPSELDMDTVAFLFTHPACLRTVVFSIQEHEPVEVRNLFGFHKGQGYGSPSRCRAAGVDGVLSISHITSQFSNDWDRNVPIAQAMLQSLVDTKFKSYMKD
jgi:hypothetical protein